MWQNARTKLAYTSEPTATATAGVPFSATISVEGPISNVVPNASNAVTLHSCQNSGCTGSGASTKGTLTGIGPVSASAGVATFTNLIYNKAETIFLQANSAPLTSDISTGVTVAAGPPNSVIIEGTTYLGSGACMGPFTTGVIDAYNNLATFSSDTPINLASTGALTFYASSACGSSVTSVTLLANGTGVFFWVKDSTANDTPLITAQAAGVNNGTFQASVSSPSIGVHLATDSSCAINHSGGVLCWGHNQFGQLGNVTFTDSFVPVAVSGLTNVIALGGGFNFHCALKSDTTVWCWGQGTTGQLGNNGAANHNSPVQVKNTAGTAALSGVSAIAMHGEFSMCAIVGGAAYCWGSNASGQVGVGTATSTYKTPQPVSGLTANVTSIDSGQDHSCAVVSGNLYCWGGNEDGQLGLNSTTPSTSPVEVLDSTGLANLTGVTLVSAGNLDTCALVSGAAQCWGDNTTGQLGNGTTAQSLLPVQVSGLTSGVAAISIGTGNGASFSAFACAVVGGGLQCWGNNGNGELGTGGGAGSSTPAVAIPASSGVTAIVTGSNSTAAIMNNNLLLWGFNGGGQIGREYWQSNIIIPMYPVSIY